MNAEDAGRTAYRPTTPGMRAMLGGILVLGAGGWVRARAASG
jgi:hypothetical protein